MSGRKIFGILFLVLFAVLSGRAQTPAFRGGEVLFGLKPEATAEWLVHRAEAEGVVLTSLRCVAGWQRVWLVHTEHGKEAAAVQWLFRQPEVSAAQLNYLLTERGSAGGQLIPNDPLYLQQWYFKNTGAGGGLAGADLGAEEAWNYTVGGLTPSGDTIVVAVIDRGVEETHPDLRANLWINHAEVPKDGIDNDLNGYVDDARGWSVYTSTDEIGGLSVQHGTPVSGMLGARGDNTVGMSGVNWKIKILFVASSSVLSDVLAAYDYILANRKAFNASNGKSGAFIVGVNTSWGIDYGQPAQAPLWCSALDSLGAAGIISLAATANLPINVDLSGDLPTTCPSNYLVSVTSLTRADTLSAKAAWGPKHIDLGAYGASVLCTAAGKTYSVFDGTSFATPQVAGAVALLYAAPCPELAAQSQADPAGTALAARTLLLNNTRPNISLANRTATNGRLQLNDLLQTYVEGCAECPLPFGLAADFSNPLSVKLKWAAWKTYTGYDLRWRLKGVTGWATVSGVFSPFLLGTLLPCRTYEFSIRAKCANGEMTDWSAPLAFTTAGCCLPPADIKIIYKAEPGTVQLYWTENDSSQTYKVRYQKKGATAWVYVNTPDNFISLSGLADCTDYAVEISSLCQDSASAYSAAFMFKTQNCGSCQDGPYCTAQAANTGEWIKEVVIGNWSNNSGTGGGGYQNFTASADQPVLYSNKPENIVLKPGFLNNIPFKEYFRIYIDFNTDGDFTDPDELAFDGKYASEDPTVGILELPAGVKTGVTRMRVLMKSISGIGNPPMPCETFPFGQVEDYCVQIKEEIVSSVEKEGVPPNGWYIWPQPAHNEAWIALDENSTTAQIRVFDFAGIQQYYTRFTGNRLALPVGQWPRGLYILELEREGVRERKLLLLV